MNAFLRARTAFGFEYLICFRAEHNDADRDITGIEGLLFRNRLNGGEKIVSKIQSSGPEVADGAKPDVPTTDVETKKKKKNTVYFMTDIAC